MTARSSEYSSPLSWMMMARLSAWSRSDHASFWPFWRKVLKTNTVEMCDAAEAANLSLRVQWVAGVGLKLRLHVRESGQVGGPGIGGTGRDVGIGHHVQDGLTDDRVLLHAHPLVDPGECVRHALRHVNWPMQVGREDLKRVDVYAIAAGVQFQRVGRRHEFGRQCRRGEALAVVEDDGDDVLLGQLRGQGRDRIGLPEPALAKDEDVRVGRAAPRVWVPRHLFAGLGVRPE